MDALGYRGAGVSLLLADDAELLQLNAAFRGQPQATDILSWRYGQDPHPTAPLGDAPLGDLAVSLQRARAQARENGWNLHTELLRLLAHGCAHLAGFDHQTAEDERHMRGLEVDLLARLGLRGIYPEDDGGELDGPIREDRSR